MSLDRKILIAKEAAEHTRLTLQGLYELCRTDPSFPKIVIGKRRYRFSKEALNRWLESGGSKKEEEK